MAANLMFNRLDLSHFFVQQLLEIDACTRCSACVPVCPLWEITGNDDLAPMQKIREVQRLIGSGYGLKAKFFGAKPMDKRDLTRFSDTNFQCLLCNRCAQVCPVMIDTRRLWLTLRETAVEMGVYPQQLDMLKERVIQGGNITGDEQEIRLAWQKEIKYRTGTKVIYWVGCVSSLYGSTYGIPKSVMKIFSLAGVDVLTLGAEERCCGFPLIGAGMKDRAREIAEDNLKLLKSTNSNLVVTSCPTCFRTLKYDYPELLGDDLGIEVLHTTQLVARLLEDGHIKPRAFNKVVTYHDPCDLGRNSQIYEEPRAVLGAIPGLDLVEMPENRELSQCCGGGGNLESVDSKLASEVTARRLNMAVDTGAKVLASACGQCKRRLATSARKSRTNIMVLDVMEILADSLP